MAADAARRWARWRDFSASFADAQPCESLSEGADSGACKYLEALAMAERRNQEILRAAQNDPRVRDLTVGILDPVEHYSLPQRDFVKRAVSRLIPTNVLLTLDGRWIDGSLNEESSEIQPRGDDYFFYADEYLENLNDDVVIVRIRFHS
ncbi:hypothetical protein [Streptomyces sp. NPDC059994]|uniref:hypothetical protein n=1 Tax=Streptomyces sp. NPDC059994 TaxID=3347029 RepID=UPI0036BB978E